MSSVALAVLTRDLRVHDNPVLSAAAHEADAVVPVFVLDEAILRSAYNRPNRARFLAESHADLDASLADRGAGLVVRRGRWPEEVARLAQEAGAASVHVAGDVTGYSRRRLTELREGLGHDVRVE
ncbi:MAG TPA: deoxyribodipyrimidine photo-lyase, partial [Actinomycetes bacterium]